MSVSRLFSIFFLVAGIAGAVVVLRRDAPPPEPSPEPQRLQHEEPALPLPAAREPLGTRPKPEEPPPGIESRFHEKNREAIAALERGDIDAAIVGFEACHDAYPDEPVFAANLAETLARLATRRYEEGLAEEALEVLERAIELAPDRTDLKQRRDRWREARNAEADFWREESEHFELAYDGSRDEILHGATALIDGLETAYQDFGELFGRFPVERGRPKIRVVLYRREEFDSITGLGDWAGGVFDGTVRIPVEDLSDEQHRLERVLRHELVHAYVKDAGGNGVPGWLNEGLAQRLEWPSPSERARALAAARRKLEGHDPFPLERLAGSLASWKDDKAIARAYAQSLVLVAELERQYGERLVFDLVAGYGQSKPAEDTFRERTGLDLAAFARDVR